MLKGIFIVLIALQGVLLADFDLWLHDAFLLEPPKTPATSPTSGTSPQEKSKEEKKKEPTKMNKFFDRLKQAEPVSKLAENSFCMYMTSDEIRILAYTDIVSLLRDYFGINLMRGGGTVHGETDYTFVIDGQAIPHLRELSTRIKDIAIERIESIRMDKVRRIVFINTIPLKDRIFTRMSGNTGFYHYDGNDLYLCRDLGERLAIQGVFSNRKMNGSLGSIVEEYGRDTYKLAEQSKFWQRHLSLTALPGKDWILSAGFLGNEYQHNWVEGYDSTSVYRYTGYDKTYWFNIERGFFDETLLNWRFFKRYTPRYKPNHLSDIDQSFVHDYGSSIQLYQNAMGAQWLLDANGDYSVEEYNETYVKSLRSSGFIGPSFISQDRISRIGAIWVLDRGPKGLPGGLGEIGILNTPWAFFLSAGYKPTVFDPVELYSPQETIPSVHIEKQVYASGEAERYLYFYIPFTFRLGVKGGKNYSKVTDAHVLPDGSLYMEIKDYIFTEPFIYAHTDSLPYSFAFSSRFSGYYRQHQKYEQQGFFELGRNFQITKSLSVQGYGRMHLAYQETFNHLLGFGISIDLDQFHAWVNLYNGTEQRRFGSVGYVEGAYLRYGFYLNLFE